MSVVAALPWATPVNAMIGLLFCALVVGPAVAGLMWHDGASVALAAASLSASVTVLWGALVAAYRSPATRRLRHLHERGTAQGHFGLAWRASAHP